MKRREYSKSGPFRVEQFSQPGPSSALDESLVDNKPHIESKRQIRISSCDKTGFDEQCSVIAEEGVLFLEREYTEEEYQGICRNLNDFFSILNKWAEKAKDDEKKSVQ